MIRPLPAMIPAQGLARPAAARLVSALIASAGAAAGWRYPASLSTPP
jgi:hypothetical protein